MVKLRNEGMRLSRGLAGDHKHPGRALALTGCLLIAFGLLVLSRLDHPVTRFLRGQIADTLAPVLHAAAWTTAPLRTLPEKAREWVGAREELARLREENADLKRWRLQAQDIDRRLNDLSSLAHLVRDPSFAFVTARVIASSDLASAERILVGAGRGHNVRAGYPALGPDGVVGRVVDVGSEWSRIILLSDPASRVPVSVGPSAARAVMVGGNGKRPRLLPMSNDGSIQSGDEVTTSGVGGVFPNGLRVGTVQLEGAGYVVEPFSRLDRLVHVSILFYDNPTSALIEEAGSHPSLLASGGRAVGGGRGVESR